MEGEKEDTRYTFPRLDLVKPVLGPVLLVECADPSPRVKHEKHDVGPHPRPAAAGLILITHGLWQNVDLVNKAM